MFQLIKIILLLILISINCAFGAGPRLAITPLLINDKLFLPSGWLSASITGTQMNGYGTYGANHLYIPSPMYFSNTMDLTINYGLTDTWDFLFDINYTQNKSSLRSYNKIGDTLLSLGYNIIGPTQPDTNLRLSLSLLIPTGKFSRLNYNLYTNDATGGGSYQPSLGFTFSHSFQLNPDHSLTLYSNSGLTYAYDVTLSGLSAYGGTESTTGIIRPGNTVNFLIGTTYSLTDKWSASFEYSIYASQPSRFKGLISENLKEYIQYRLSQTSSSRSKNGYERPRTKFNAVFPTIHNIGGQDFLGSGAVTMLSMNPSLSYNITDSYNLVFIFSVSSPGGRNTTAFYSPSLTLTKTISA